MIICQIPEFKNVAYFRGYQVKCQNCAVSGGATAIALPAGQPEGRDPSPAARHDGADRLGVVPSGKAGSERSERLPPLSWRARHID